MDNSTNENYKSLIEQDLMLPDNMVIQNNLSMTDFNISKEDWTLVNDVPKHVDKINFFLIIGISMSLLLFVIGLAIMIKNGTMYGLYLTLFSLFMSGIFIYGIFSLRSFQIKADEIVDKQAYNRPEELDTSSEYALMNVFYILLMLFFISCLFVTIMCFGFQSTYLNPIRTAAMNQNTWKKYYGDMKYDDVYGDSKTLMTIAACTGLVISLLTLASLYISFRMIGAYKSWQNINEFVCVVIFIFGFVMIYYGVYCIKFSSLINTNKSMPKTYPDSLIIAGCASILISLLGFTGSFLENKRLIKVFAILSVISSIFLLSILIASIMIGINFTNNYKCKDFLQLVTEDYAVETLGCDQKYSDVGKNSENMYCPKDRLVDAWEESSWIRPIKSNDSSVCLDPVCCSNIVSSTKRNLSLISVFAFFMFILTVTISGGSFFINEQSPHKAQFGIQNKLVKWVLLAVASVIALVILILMSLIPEIKFAPSVNHPAGLIQNQGLINNSVEHIENLMKQHGSAFLKNLKGNNGAK